MMKMSRRAQRMERHHARRKQPALNLVSLMDIFTILVFFLLVSSSSDLQLPNRKDIHLPTSIAQKAPKETLLISVTQRTILVQGREVANIDQILSSDSTIITGLQNELDFQSSRTPVLQSSPVSSDGRAVTIMGDENISYDLLRKILATCREANYTQIAFAAMQKAANGENS